MFVFNFSLSCVPHGKESVTCSERVSFSSVLLMLHHAFLVRRGRVCVSSVNIAHLHTLGNTEWPMHRVPELLKRISVV